MNALRDRAAIVGIDQTPFARGLGRSEYDMAVEAILAACADAGIAPTDIDGVVRYDMESVDEEMLLSICGPDLCYCAGTSFGGGGAVSVLAHAAMAIATGMADHVLVFRSRARGKKSIYGSGQNQGGRFQSQLLDCAPDRIEAGMPVEAVFVAASDEITLVKFRRRRA